MATRRLTVGAPGHLLPPVENLIRNTQRSEAQGYDAVWWPDHLMGWYPDGLWTPEIVELARYQPNPHVFFDALLAMAAVAPQTERVLLGTSVTEPLRRHPATLAQAFLTLDHLSKGRVILGIGAGEAENVVPYGLDYRHQAAKLEEALAIIRLLWEHDEPVDFDGRFWSLRRAVLGLGPYRPGIYPPIYVAAAGPRTLAIAGRYADGWLPTLMPPDEYGAKFAALKRAAAAHGRNPERIVGALWTYTVIAETHEECHRLLEHPLIKVLALVRPAEVFERHGVRHPLGARAYGIRDFIPTHLSREAALAAIARVPLAVVHEFVLHGTPDEIVAALGAYAAQGLQHVVFWNVTFFADLSKLRPSFDLLRVVLARCHAGV
jgi:phthiodiolone/phenolphthiodiolone dimycocerosates ketoreductase